MTDDLVSRATIKAQMLRMGEPVAFGSDADVIDELVKALTEARAEIERLREAAKGQNAVVNTVWNTFVDAPEPGRKFVALYTDGSGARMFFAFDGGVIDYDGAELYGFDLAEQSYGLWAYLPDNFEFWCETRAEDPMTLKVIR